MPHGAHRAGTAPAGGGPAGQALDERELAGLRTGWEDLPALLRGEPPKPGSSTPPLPGFEALGPDAAAAPQWEQADLPGLQVERSREFGESYLALSRWHRVGLDKLLVERLPAGRESVAWARVAEVLTLARCGGQPSELGVAEQWFGVRFEFLLYDVTSTCFEGQAGRNPQAERG